eukprot:CAMPEP_0118869300 /NCGR_PEP_ID=MMETSP1163-20130328/12684_1 /TAXON_ID=124430 /ORGANISM="Phaeomonas parva, Strain CCMP2877" /LENGTH=254 /DNA_ID=CAMNT_0006804179 /DNA_START=26 /DNA_END=791 /DNA_ORIENTATION=+
MPRGKAKYDHLVKLLVIGDACVGKSSVLLRYSENAFSNSYLTTIGIDFKVKMIAVNGKRVKLQIWDTAGQERFRTITQAYYRGAMGILLVFDVGNRKSFKNVAHWMRQIDQNATEDVVKIILGNKADIEARQVSTEEGENLASEYGVAYFETSAKTGQGVADAFGAIAGEVVGNVERSGGRAAAKTNGAANGSGQRQPNVVLPSNRLNGGKQKEAAAADGANEGCGWLAWAFSRQRSLACACVCMECVGAGMRE